MSGSAVPEPYIGRLATIGHRPGTGDAHARVVRQAGSLAGGSGTNHRTFPGGGGFRAAVKELAERDATTSELPSLDGG
jgi:hypothetical protein